MCTYNQKPNYKNSKPELRMCHRPEVKRKLHWSQDVNTLPSCGHSMTLQIQTNDCEDRIVLLHQCYA